MQILPFIVTALVPMLMGFIWYHPKLFGDAWMRAAGLTEEQLKSGKMALIFGISFVASLLLTVGMNTIAIHDNFISGALYYITNGTMNPEAGSEPAKWLEYYNANLAASNHTFKHGAFHGFLIAGLFIVLPVLTTGALFERKNFKYIAINAGYWIVTLSLMGGIAASWR